MLRFAIASLKYHKRTTTLYFCLVMLLGTSLLLINTLIASLPFYLKQVKKLLNDSGYQESDAIIWAHLQETTNHLHSFYTSIYLLQLPFIFCIFTVFFIYLQHKKRNELRAWKQSGSSWQSWLRLSFTETLPTLLVFFAIASFVVLLLQSFISSFILETHLHVMTFLDKQDHPLALSQIGQVNMHNQFVIRFPETNQALLESIRLTSDQVPTLLFHALGKALATLFLLISLTNLIVTGSHSYWRYHQWKKQTV